MAEEDVIEDLVHDYAAFAASTEEAPDERKSVEPQKPEIEKLTSEPDGLGSLQASVTSRQVESVVCELMRVAEEADWRRLADRWAALHERILNCVNNEQLEQAAEFEDDMYKLRFVRCLARGEKPLCEQFLEERGPYIRDSPAWNDFFQMLHMPNPAEHETFQLYSAKSWSEIFVISLHNFFNLILQNRTAPVTLAYFDKDLNGEMTLEQLRAAATTPTPSGERDEEGESDADGNPDGLPKCLGNPDEDLIDDFAVIAQCTGPLKTSSSKSSIKSLIKSITVAKSDREADVARSM